MVKLLQKIQCFIFLMIFKKCELIFLRTNLGLMSFTTGHFATSGCHFFLLGKCSLMDPKLSLNTKEMRKFAGLQLPWQNSLPCAYSVEVETSILTILRDPSFPRLCICRQKQKQPKPLLCVLQAGPWSCCGERPQHAVCLGPAEWCAGRKTGERGSGYLLKDVSAIKVKQSQEASEP